MVAECGGLKGQRVDDVIIGCAMPEAEQGLNVARIATLLAGLPDSVPGVTVNRFCASGVQSIAMAADRIRLGEADILIAGGVESGRSRRAPTIVGLLRQHELSGRDDTVGLDPGDVDAGVHRSAVIGTTVPDGRVLAGRQITVDQSIYEPPATQRQAKIDLDKSKRAYDQAVGEHELKPFSHPRVELPEEEPLAGAEFTGEFDLTLRPDVELGEYKGLEVESALTPVTDEEVEAAEDALAGEQGVDDQAHDDAERHEHEDRHPADRTRHRGILPGEGEGAPSARRRPGRGATVRSRAACG